jgi:hypothetical protein
MARGHLEDLVLTAAVESCPKNVLVRTRSVERRDVVLMAHNELAAIMRTR